ncbi:hypothetical protein DI019_07155 [Legionella pneumophila]|nr:hypothetical protein DM459_07160 [Legionella pneumophila]PYB56603.1 hypothetical protein DM457_07160 [Legionella pneumophila]PYB59505.1 hypothetical protein DM458_09100 [Legionella pneumophila]TID53380.1 hypothetical protein DIZ65_07160 [Legionella pneumophila]TIE48671.1 hypothetical protein DIZ53_07160 [Legionella pneumophila]
MKIINNGVGALGRIPIDTSFLKEYLRIQSTDILHCQFGRGYGKINLTRMLKLSRIFPNREIVSTLSKQLSWSHFVMVWVLL